jgi:glyoxylase-like metal-dependent hydrolase (beta-lactamase superfamily II)
MLQIKSFTFNPFQENMYVVYNELNHAIIFDPGCYAQSEQNTLKNFISENNLKPKRLINTHCHIDHVLGNPFVHRTYHLLPEFHQNELSLLQAVESYGHMWGIQSEIQPEPISFLDEYDKITLDNDELEIRFTPGHSPASLCFVSHAHKWIIGGDVLFYQSIGRTDLPGGDYNTLIESIKNQIFTLPDDYVVFPGHGPSTSLGYEKNNNPFLV